MQESHRLIDEPLRLEDEQNINEAGFQPVVNKAKKKNMKASSSKVSNPHKTRSKAGNPKPFI